MDLDKLQQFVEAALTNPRHPIYQAGMQRSAILQDYAINVALLKTMSPEQWFKEKAEYTAKLQQVMELCETEAAEQAAAADELGQMKMALAALRAELDELKKPKEAPAETEPEPEPEAAPEE